MIEKALEYLLEERERELRRLREESGQHHTQRFFAQNKDGRWIPKFTCVSLLRLLSESALTGATQTQNPKRPRRSRARGATMDLVALATGPRDAPL